MEKIKKNVKESKGIAKWRNILKSPKFTFVDKIRYKIIIIA